MNRKSTVVIALMMVLLATFFIKVGFSKKSDIDKKNAKDKAQKQVSAYVISTSSIINDLSVSGSLIAFDEVELKNEVAGRVVVLNLPEGGVVKKGTLLVKLFDDDLVASLKKAESQLSVKQQIFKRQTELLKVNGVSQNDYDQTGLEIKTIQADIYAVKASIRKTEIRAPFDGYIGLRNVSVGAVIPAATSIATLRASDKLKLDFSVPEKYSSLVVHGMKVDFTVNDNENYTATVYATERGIDVSTRNFKVRALVDSRSSQLIPGAFANVALHLGDSKSAILIPTGAIIPQEDSKQVIVAKNGQAHFVTIKTGVRQSANIEVKEGLQVGDTLITTGIQFIKEKAKLKYANVKTQL